MKHILNAHQFGLGTFHLADRAWDPVADRADVVPRLLVKRPRGGRMFFPDHACPLHGLVAAAAAVERGAADVIDMTPENDAPVH